MKICFIARHDSGDNDDEGAVLHALQSLGHSVLKIPERKCNRYLKQIHEFSPDFVLLNKCPEVKFVIQNRKLSMVFWYWDMVDVTEKESEDRVLAERARQRVDWMNQVMPHCLVGFCTDGDWVARHTNKLVQLMQGADIRTAGYGKSSIETPPILFTGTIRHGDSRRRHIEHLQNKWGDQFLAFGNEGPRSRKHGRELADLFASTKIVVAPDGPQTDRYCSNRIYLTLGLGGFLLHPYCEFLSKHYKEGEEVVFYRSQEELDDQITYYLTHEEERERIRKAGHEKTVVCHTYTHRCKELVSIVSERLANAKH